jgi:hypothetical protein
MSGLYDRLMDQLDDDDNEQPAGLTPLDIAELPEGQRQVMFALLRDTRAATNGVTVEALQEKLGPVEGLDGVLNDLTRNSWLIRLGESPNVRYKVNLRRKRGSTLGGSIWASLSSRLADEDKGQEQDQSKHNKPDLPALSDW